MASFIAHRKAVALDKAKDDLIQAKDREQALNIAKVKTDAETKIAVVMANSEEKISQAKTEADKQMAALKTKSDEALAKQMELERQNLLLRTDLNKEIGEVAKLQIRAVSAEQDLLKLQDTLRPRHFTDLQKKQLISVLDANPKGDILVRCLNGIQESCAFAKEIVEVLTAAGWTTAGPRDEVLFGETGMPPTGLIIIIKDQQSEPVRAKILQRSLTQIGFNAPGLLDNRLKEGEVQLFVGVKP